MFVHSNRLPMSNRQSSRIAARNLPVSLDDPEPPPFPHPKKKKRKTAAEATRDWKKRMQNDNPEKYADFQEKWKQSSKVYRQNCSEERRAIQREQTKLRMRALREKKKLEVEQQHTQKPRKTRATQEEQRAKWREEKQKWWGKKTEREKKQKRRRINEARVVRYKEKKLAASVKTTASSMSTPEVAPQSHSELDLEAFQAFGDTKGMLDAPTVNDARTPAAKRKAVSRARRLLPASPRKFVRRLNDLVTSASPRKRALFSFKLQTDEKALEHQIGKQVLKNLRSLSKQRSKAVRNRRSVLMSVCYKYPSLRKSSSLLGVHRKTVSKVVNTGSLSPKITTDHTITKKLETEAVMFFEAESHPLPEAKLVSQKTGKCSSVLSKPLKDLHAEFLESGNDISFSHFAKCRPTHVRPMRQASLRQCLCEYCTNVELKLRAVNGIAARLDNNCRIRHVYHAVDIITCGRHEGVWRKTCAYRECSTCSVDQ